MATQQQYYGTGRRKSAVARVFLRPGKGQITVNGKPVDEFFSRETGRMIVRQPLELASHMTTFDILVNDVKIATEDLNKYKASRFYEIVYPIPADITKGKEKVTITFKPAAYNMVGPVYGEVRMMR